MSEQRGPLRVSFSLRPKVREIGVGEPLVAEGAITLLGLPMPVPILVIVHRAERSGTTPEPIAWGFTAPFLGLYRIHIPTDEWGRGRYLFAAVATPLIGSPVRSQQRLKQIARPRHSARVQVGWEHASPVLTIRQDQGDRVYCDWTVENTGNVSDTYDCVLVLGLPGVQQYTYRADNIVSLAPGESSSHIVPVDVPVGAPLGLYHGYCRIYGEVGAFAEDIQVQVVEVVEAPAPPPPDPLFNLGDGVCSYSDISGWVTARTWDTTVKEWSYSLYVVAPPMWAGTTMGQLEHNLWHCTPPEPQPEPEPEPEEAPDAHFTASPTSGDAPLTVDFTDTSIGDIDSWSWTFGDGGTSSSRNPSHTYANPGTYTATLTVTGPGGSDSATITITVTEPAAPPPEAPGAWFTASPTSGTAPLTVQFTEESTGEIDTWSWTFGDGGTSSARNPSHTYTEPGSYVVILVVEGPGGGDTASLTIPVYEHVYTFDIGDIVTDDDFIYEITERKYEFGENYYWCVPTDGGTTRWIPESGLRSV